MILSILRLNHGLSAREQSMVELYIYIYCIVFCVGAELNRGDRV